MNQSTSHPQNDVSNQNSNEANIDELQTRAQRQFTYLLIGAVLALILGAVTLGTTWKILQFHHIVLISAATIIGTAILLISAVDMKANERGFRRYRDEQQTMERLSEKYRKSPRDGRSANDSENEADSPTQTESQAKRSNPK